MLAFMMAFPDPTRQELSYDLQLAILIATGRFHLEDIWATHGRVTYVSWVHRVREGARNIGVDISNEHLVWLWDTLRTEPELRRTVGTLPEADKATQPMQKQTVDVLPAGSLFRLYLRERTFPDEFQQLPPDKKPTVYARITEILHMQPGKGARFECCPVKTELVVYNMQNIDLDAEARAFQVNRGDVEQKGTTLVVKVASLNHAYTKASLRFEPRRMSHGGRIYDNLFWRKNQEEEILLELIRSQVEAGTWKMP